MTDAELQLSSSSRERATTNPTGVLPWLIITLAWLTALSSRSTIIGVGPVLPLMIKDLHLSFTQAGLVFSIPEVMMGLFAIPGGLIVARLGVKPSLIISLVLLGSGSALRAVAGSGATLLTYTVVMGIGIGLVQPSLPQLVKDWFPHRAGLATSIYSSGFTLGAVLSAGLAVPVLLPLFGSLSWRGTFLFWSVIVWLTLLVVIFVRGSKPATKASLASFGRIFRNRLCWLTAVLFLTQSMLYYTLNSWLAGYYLNAGWTLAGSASALAVLSFTSIFAALGVPYLSDRLGQRRPLFIGGSVVALLCVAGLALWTQVPFWLWTAPLGFASGVMFTVCLLIPIDASHGEEVGAFSGLMFAVGYGGVIAGPTSVGFLRDATGTPNSGLPALIVMCLVMLWSSVAMPETARRPQLASTG